MLWRKLSNSFECMCLGVGCDCAFPNNGYNYRQLIRAMSFLRTIASAPTHIFVCNKSVWVGFKGNRANTLWLCCIECMGMQLYRFFMDGRGSMTFEISSDTFCSRLLSAEKLCPYGIARQKHSHEQCHNNHQCSCWWGNGFLIYLHTCNAASIT